MATLNQDVGDEYAASLSRDRDSALESRYLAMAEEDAPQPTSNPTTTTEGPASSVAQAGLMDASGGDTPANMAGRTIAANVRETPLQLLFGAATGVKQAASTVGLSDGAPVGREPKTALGGIARGVGQFMPGFVAASAAIAALPETLAGAGLVALAAKARPLIAGAVAGTLDFDPKEPRISNFIQETGLANPMTEWLAADPNDGAALATFKSAIENTGLGAASEGIVALSRLNRARIVSNRLLTATTKKTPEAVAADAMKAATDILDPVVDMKAITGGDPAGKAVQVVDVPPVQPTAGAARLADAEVRAAGVTPDVVAGAPATASMAVRVNAENTKGWSNLAIQFENGKVVPLADAFAPENPRGIQWIRYTREDGTTGRTLGIGSYGKDGGLSSIRFGQFGPKRLLAEAVPAQATPKAAPQKVYLNLARIDTADDVRGAIDFLASKDADAINAARGGEHQTFAEVTALADAMGLKAEDVIGRQRGAMGAAEAVAARKLLTSSGEQLTALARRAASADATAADLAAFQKSTAVHYALQTEVIAARTETARALASWRIPAPAGGELRLSDVHAALSAAGGPQKVAEIARRMAMLADNPAAQAAAVRDGFKTGFGAVWKQLWFNGLLSSPRTHVANISDNAITALWAIPERAATAAVSQAFGGGDVAMGEAGALFWGMMRGARDGITAAGKALKTGQGSDLFNKIESNAPSAIRAETFGADPTKALGHGINAIGKVIDAPSTLLMSADEFFKAVNYRMQLNALAYRTARSEGLTGAEFGARMKDIVANPPDSVMQDAVGYGRTNTYTSQLGPIAGKIAELRDVIPGAHFVAPFVRTPANIMKFSFERTPLAPLSGSVRADIAAGGARADAAWAKIGLGTTVMTAAADMVANGEMVGGGPGEPSMRAARERQGIPQYAVKVGGEWVSFERLGFTGTLLGLAADAAEMTGLAGFEDSERTVASVGLLFVKSMANKTYLQGIFKAAAIVADPNTDKPAAEFIKQIASSVVPFSAAQGSIARAGDPTSRETRTALGDTESGPLGLPSVEDMRGTLSDPGAVFVREFINKVRSRTPGLSDSLPPVRDLWGRPKEYTSNLGVAYDFAIPFKVSTEKPDKVDQAIIANGIDVSMPQRSIDRVPLTGEEYSEYVRIAGETAKRILDEHVASPDFAILSDGPDGLKADVIKGVIEETRAAARAEMVARFPGLASRIEAQAMLRNQLLTQPAGVQ